MRRETIEPISWIMIVGSLLGIAVLEVSHLSTEGAILTFSFAIYLTIIRAIFPLRFD